MRTLSLLLLLLPTLAFAAEPAVAVSHAWAPPSLGAPNAVAFLTLQSTEDDALVAIDSDCCKAVEMHSSQVDGDVIRMRQLKRVALPKGKAVVFAPGAQHIMLIGLKAPLKDDGMVMLTLHFEHAPEQMVHVAVDKSKMLQSHDSMAHDDMSHMQH